MRVRKLRNPLFRIGIQDILYPIEPMNPVVRSVLRIPGMFIPDPGSKRFWFPYPGFESASNNSSILDPKNVYKLSEKWSAMFIPDPGVKKATDPDPQHCVRLNVRNPYIFLETKKKRGPLTCPARGPRWWIWRCERWPAGRCWRGRRGTPACDSTPPRSTSLVQTKHNQEASEDIFTFFFWPKEAGHLRVKKKLS